MEEAFPVGNASLADVQQALVDGRTSSTALTQAYIARIAAYDRAGPSLNSVREVNPDALAIAALADGQKPSNRCPLAGIPVLVKDNIATADGQHTTAGSLALGSARARQDATVVRQLRAAGAVILGKANLKRDLNAYLSEWASETPILTMADVIAFNDAHADRALRFGQDLFLAAEATRGDLSEPEYRSARAMDLRSAAMLGLDAYMEAHRLDAVLFPGRAGASIAAKAGYPSVQVPAGFIAGFNGRDTPDYPLGATFTGRAWSEPTLLRLAYAFERRPRRAVRRLAMPLDAAPPPLARPCVTAVDRVRPISRGPSKP